MLYHKQKDTLDIKYGITYCPDDIGFEVVLVVPVIPFVGHKLIFYFSHLTRRLTPIIFNSWAAGFWVGRRSLFDIVLV